MLELTIKKREGDTSTRMLRDNQRMPAVYYGKETESTPISVFTPDFKQVFQEAGESTVITLIEKQADDEKGALVQDVQVHPVTDEPMHADFYIFAEGQKVEVDVPLEFVGTAPAVKNQGAMLVKVMREIEVEAEPTNLPDTIEVDISSLEEFEDTVTVQELHVPADVEILADENETVVLAAEPVEEEEEEEEMEVDFDEMVEVEGEKEPDEELAEDEVTDEEEAEGDEPKDPEENEEA